MTEADFIAETLREVGAFARDRYENRKNLSIAQKSDLNDLVTEADLAVQRQVVERIGRAFPGDYTLAEESGLGLKPENRPDRCWILDPIDGTQNFVRGLFPMWGVSLAFAKGGEVVAGGVLFPVTGDLFQAERGAGTRRNGERISASPLDAVDRARIDFDVSASRFRDSTLEAAGELYRRVGQIRIHGCAVAALCSVATGDLEAYLPVSLSPWDYAAGALIAEEAGGRCTDLRGKPITYFEGLCGILATNGALHDDMLSLLRNSA
jgi:myo-inositol-1(or 4)-monophosphatase